jgi:rod shape-determining protein MreB and related proteins
VLSKKIGIDLGGSAVQIYVKGEGVVVDEPALFDGPVTEEMLHWLIGKVQGRIRMFKPELMISVPSGDTLAQRRAVAEAAISAGARQVRLVDRPLAAAIGAGLPIHEARGIVVCDIGAATTEIAVIAQSGMVVARSIHVGGSSIDEARVSRGIDEALNQIVAAIRGVLEEAPPRVVAGIAERGIVLTGAGAQVPGLDRHMATSTGIPCRVAENPQTSVVRGAGLALDNLDVLKRNQAPLR